MLDTMPVCSPTATGLPRPAPQSGGLHCLSELVLRGSQPHCPSLRMMLLRCVSVVFTLRSNTVATSFVLLPSARSCTTSRSRAVNRGRLISLVKPVHCRARTSSVARLVLAAFFFYLRRREAHWKPADIFEKVRP